MTRFGRWAWLPAALLAASLRAAPGEVELTTLDNVKVGAFAQLLSDATGRPFVVASDIDAAFTVVVPSGAPLRLQPKEMYDFGVTVLASAGLTVVEDGATTRILKLPEGGGLAFGATPRTGTPAEGLVTRVFRLQHVSAEDVRRALDAGGARKGWVAVLEDSNHLVVTDTARTLERVDALLQEIDQPGLARVTEVVVLQFADAEQLAQQLNTAATESESRAGQLASRLQTPAGAAAAGGARTGLAVPAPHANAVILVGPQQQIDSFKLLIAKLDVDTPTGRGHLNAIPLQYLKAEDAAKSISALLEKSAAKSADGKGVRRIAVESSAVNNALLVDASPNDFDLLKRLVEQLDRMPEQVHIAVQIVEIVDGKGFTLGTQFTALNKPGEVGDTVVSGATRLNTDEAPGVLENAGTGIFPQGLNVALSHGVGLGADGELIVGYPGIVNLAALKETDKIEILSETALQAQNNCEASVSIVDDIPILKSTIQGGSGSSRDVIQNIERLEVGVKLKLTPHVVPGGLVRMELSPSIEAVTSVASAENQFTPTIAKRTATTTVTVPTGETIVIAGLTRKDRQVIDKRIPWLGDIPLLGWLFRYKSSQEKTTNLLILVTPDILGLPGDAQRTTRAWRTKTGIENDGQPPEAQHP